jgi:phage shock protein PspC (stress-responsive transcriptional regulator)
MKETVKINLNQRLFDLDADAYSKLKNYLDTLRRYFDKKPDEAEEILQDIEQRIAEILEEKLKGNKEAVSLKDIEEIIQMMGTPADFARDNDLSGNEEQEDESAENKESGDDYNRDHRRLYRDLDTNIIGGVCSGIASYFNIDSVWVRIAFVILCILNGIGLLIYIILWVVVPVARTTGQRLQMKGRPVTVENIQESVKTEYEKVKDNLNKYSHSESFRRTRDTVNDIFTTLGRIILTLMKVILIIFGVAIAIAAVACIMALVGVFSSGENFNTLHFHGLKFHDQVVPLFHDVTIFSLALMTVIVIPVIAIFAGIIRLVFNLRSRYGVLSAFAWTLWSLALVYVIISAISGNKLVSDTYKQKDEVTLALKSAKPLYIKIGKTSITGSDIGYYTFFGREIIHDKREEICYLKPHVYFETSGTEAARMMIEHTYTIPTFYESDNEIRDQLDNDYNYAWQLQDTLLLLSEYFSLDEDEIWQLPGMRLTIYIPENQRVVLDRSLKEFIGQNNEDADSMRLEYDMPLIMEKGKLLEHRP